MHIVCSNCSEEPMSPLHRGINISSSSIGSQEVDIMLIIASRWQSRPRYQRSTSFQELVQSPTRRCRSAKRRGDSRQYDINTFDQWEPRISFEVQLFLKNCLQLSFPPILWSNLCGVRQYESRQGRFSGLARLFSLPGKSQMFAVKDFSLCQAPPRGEPSSTAPSVW